MLARWLIVWLLSHPTSAVCPPGHDLRTGVRRDGQFMCWPAPVAPRGWNAARLGPVTDWDGTFGRPERSLQSAAVTSGRVYCTGRAVPRQDGRKVWCE